MAGFVDSTLNDIQTQLDEYMEQLGVNSKIDEWIQDYLNASAPFLRAMESLDKFAQCAFDGCNFVQTALNKREDVEERLYVKRVGQGWSVKADKIIRKAQIKENDLRARIDNLRIRIANPKFDSLGEFKDNLLKF